MMFLAAEIALLKERETVILERFIDGCKSILEESIDLSKKKMEKQNEVDARNKKNKESK